MRSTTTQQQPAPDKAEPGMLVEKAAVLYARGRRQALAPLALSHLQTAVEQVMKLVPGCSRFEAQRGVVAEFEIRLQAKLGRVAGGDVALWRALEQIEVAFPTRN